MDKKDKKNKKDKTDKTKKIIKTGKISNIEKIRKTEKISTAAEILHQGKAMKYDNWGFDKTEHNPCVFRFLV